MRKISIMTNNRESGVVLIVCMIILLMLSLIGIASITTSNSEMQIAGNEMKATGAFYAAEAGLEKATSEVITSYETTGAPPNPLPTAMGTAEDYRYFYNVADLGPATNTTLTYGSYKGLYATVKSFEINSQGVDNNLESGVALSMGIQDALIPIFQFAVFYENDFELAPTPDMTISGRIHTNGNAYIIAGNNVYIDQLTSSGDIIKGSAPGVGMDANGNIFIRDGNGDFQNMRSINGTFLDSTDPDWVNSSSSRWGSTVEDANHGITNLNMPIAGVDNPTDLIDRASADNPDSYENDAGLKFVDGQALYRQMDGSWLDVTAMLIADGSISYSNFYDDREDVNVMSLDLDINLLSSSGYYPSNGIVYSSIPEIAGNLTAIRLTNGQQLPSGLTVATNNPLYTLGDFNTINKQPASLMADAVTILSNNWDDANSAHGAGSRVATETRVNAAFVTGSTQSGAPGHGYNGGFENLPRFLENWNGTNFVWRGSAAQLWYSRQAVSPWNGSYYNPPVRDWGFDTDFLDPANLPPGTPQVNIIMKTSWNQMPLTDFSRFSINHGYDSPQ